MPAGKQEKLRPQEVCFFLTSPFIELIRRYPSAHLYLNCNSEAISLEPVYPHNIPEILGITGLVGCIPESHAETHSDMVVLGSGREIEAVAGGIHRTLYFLLVFRVGRTGQDWP
jgi:hypothetical protein